MATYDPRKKPILFAVYASILFGLLQGVPPIVYAIWFRITDDGHGIYTAPEDIEPAPVLAEPWPAIDPAGAAAGGLPRLSAAQLRLYFFPSAESEENGLAIRRFAPKPIVVRVSTAEDLPDARLAEFASKIAKAGALPVSFYAKYNEEGYIQGDDQDPEISAYLGLKLHKPDYRGIAWRGEGPRGERMNDLGCVGRPSFWHTGGQERQWLPRKEAFVVNQAYIATWHRLDEPTVDHCLFKALLVALGLHPTEGFFFKEGPVTPAEQARALAALALVYHPAVEPGMTEAEFRAVLLENDLIDP